MIISARNQSRYFYLIFFTRCCHLYDDREVEASSPAFEQIKHDQQKNEEEGVISYLHNPTTV
jgi:hypothetical protein